MVKPHLSFFLDSGCAVSVTQNTIPAPATARAPITAAERCRREDAVRYADANIGLEGIVPTPEDIALTQRYIDGEIDLDELLAIAIPRK